MGKFVKPLALHLESVYVVAVFVWHQRHHRKITVYDQASVYTHQGTRKNSLAKMDLIWNVAASKESKPNETIMRCTILSPYINCHVCVVCTQYSLPLLYTLGRFFVLVWNEANVDVTVIVMSKW